MRVGTLDTKVPAGALSAGVASSPKSAAKGPAKSGPVSTSITELITSTVRPEIWKVINGGRWGKLRWGGTG